MKKSLLSLVIVGFIGFAMGITLILLKSKNFDVRGRAYEANVQTNQSHWF